MDKDLDIDEQSLTFEMDSLVYLGEGQHDMKKLIPFLEEVNDIVEIEAFSSDVEFRLRRLRQT